MFKSLVLIFLAALIGVAGQLLLKVGVGQIGRIDGDALKHLGALITRVCLNPWVVIGIATYGLGAVVWIVVLSRVQLSFAYPLLGLSYVLVVLSSALFLHEQVAPVRWLGVLLIVAGIALVSRTGQAAEQPAQPAAAAGSAPVIGR